MLRWSNLPEIPQKRFVDIMKVPVKYFGLISQAGQEVSKIETKAMQNIIFCCIAVGAVAAGSAHAEGSRLLTQLVWFSVGSLAAFFSVPHTIFTQQKAINAFFFYPAPIGHWISYFEEADLNYSKAYNYEDCTGDIKSYGNQNRFFVPDRCGVYSKSAIIFLYEAGKNQKLCYHSSHRSRKVHAC